MYMYKSLSKTSTNPTVSFDATGSVVRKLQRPNGVAMSSYIRAFWQVMSAQVSQSCKCCQRDMMLMQ